MPGGSASPAAKSAGSDDRIAKGGSVSTTTWRGPCGPSAITVRSTSCRRTRSPKAFRRASRSRVPVMRRTTGMVYVCAWPSSRSRNHIRRWAADSGTRSGRSDPSRRTRGGREAFVGRPDSSSASRATVACSKTSRMDSSAPRSDRTRLTSRATSRECPPRSKKSSSAPTSGTPRTAAKRSATRRSPPSAGGRPEPSGLRSGAGRALRSILPLAVSGRVSRTTKATGTM